MVLNEPRLCTEIDQVKNLILFTTNNIKYDQDVIFQPAERSPHPRQRQRCLVQDVLERGGHGIADGSADLG